MNKHSRQTKGNLLYIVIFTIAVVIMPLFLVCSQIMLYVVDMERTKNVVEAASLLAANDLSRIVVNDPNFGYVSLSNYPPVGKSTLAEDGEPLPVTGINTLVGTVRQNAILANEIGNDTMRTLVEDDRNNLEGTIAELNATLSDALREDTKRSYLDIQGARVEPVKDVMAFLKKNLPSNIKLESVRVSNGWLSHGGNTTISTPQPERLAQLKQTDSQGGLYKPFIDLPVANRSFTFAGIGNASSLVPPGDFREPDGKHISSIVRIEIVVTRGSLVKSQIPSVACAQPFSLPDVGPAGVMTIRFTGGPVLGLQSWSDFLNPGNFQDNRVTTYDVVGGDYPKDPNASMSEFFANYTPTTSAQFAEHLYYWLRNGHMRPRLDAVLSMISDPFPNGSNQIYAYEFAKDGNISRRVITRDPFPIGVTADSQFSTTADTGVQNGVHPIIIFRNNVKNLGTMNGGKHAGQALPGYPLNWCEIPEYGGDEFIAKGLSKGRLGTHLSLADPGVPSGTTGDDSSSSTAPGATPDLFRHFDGKTLFLQPRKSFYSGGLALDIEIGGTRQASTAFDVDSMRRMTR